MEPQLKQEKSGDVEEQQASFHLETTSSPQEATPSEEVPQPLEEVLPVEVPSPLKEKSPQEVLAKEDMPKLDEKPKQTLTVKNPASQKQETKKRLRPASEGHSARIKRTLMQDMERRRMLATASQIKKKRPTATVTSPSATGTTSSVIVTSPSATVASSASAVGQSQLDSPDALMSDSEIPASQEKTE